MALHILRIISKTFDLVVETEVPGSANDTDDGLSIPSLITTDISFINSNTFDLFVFNSNVNESSNSAPTSI